MNLRRENLPRSKREAGLDSSVGTFIHPFCVDGYGRLMTHPRVLADPISVAAAVSDVREWI